MTVGLWPNAMCSPDRLSQGQYWLLGRDLIQVGRYLNLPTKKRMAYFRHRGHLKKTAYV